MLENLKASDKVHVLDVIDPDAATAAAYSTGYILASDYHQFLAIIQTGILGASATVDAKLEQATTSGGAGVKDITGAAITQLVQTTNDDEQALINVSQEDFDVDNGFDYIRLTVTVGTATSDVSAILLGIEARYGGAQASTVAEVVG